MHAYSLDPIQEQNREKVNRVLFGVSVILTPIFNKLLVWIVRLVQAIPFGESVIDWLIDFGFTMSISYIMTYAMLFLLVDRLLWCTLLSKALAIPNVKGVWKGTLHSNYNGGKDIDITLIIKQTLTKISCVAQFQDSSSSSDMSKLVWINGDEIQLSFAFQNKSRDLHVAQKEYHGYNWFLIREGSMRGWYFTDRKLPDGKTTNGEMELSWVAKKQRTIKSRRGKH